MKPYYIFIFAVILNVIIFSIIIPNSNCKFLKNQNFSNKIKQKNYIQNDVREEDYLDAEEEEDEDDDDNDDFESFETDDDEIEADNEEDNFDIISTDLKK
jgi:hypothetical protein